MMGRGHEGGSPSSDVTERCQEHEPLTQAVADRLLTHRVLTTPVTVVGAERSDRCGTRRLRHWRRPGWSKTRHGRCPRHCGSWAFPAAWSPAGRPGPGRGRVRPVIVSPLSRWAMQRRHSSTT